MSNFYLVKILGEPNSLTIVTSKKNTQNEQLCAHFEYFFSQNENQEFAVQSLCDSQKNKMIQLYSRWFLVSTITS